MQSIKVRKNVSTLTDVDYMHFIFKAKEKDEIV